MTKPSNSLPMQAEPAAEGPDDLELVARSQAGDTAAFNALVTRYRSRAEIAREYYARAVQGAGALAPLEVQCDWLREAGFENVDCYLKVLELAVFGGQKPAVTA